MALASQALGLASAPLASSGADTKAASVARNRVESLELVRAGLVEHGIPHGLADVVAQDDERIGLRIYLLDNSGSMAALDGNKLCDDGNGNLAPRPCTRWEEICAFATDHARFNLLVGTPCEFVLLNSLSRSQGLPLQQGQDYVRIDRLLGDEFSQLKSLSHMLERNSPRGVTPITERLQELFVRVRGEANQLAQRGQSVFLTIATDGLPTTLLSGTSTPNDQRCLVEQLRYLGGVLPLQMVIRLCTDDKSTIDFYNRLDEELEFPVDILDDISSEGQEVAFNNKNNWFAYTPLLHRVREAGTVCKVLDLIDERPLTTFEVRQVAGLLSGSTTPLTVFSDRGFIEEMQILVSKSPLVYDAVTQEMRPVIDIAKLRVAMKVGFRGNLLPIILPCAV